MSSRFRLCSVLLTVALALGGVGGSALVIHNTFHAPGNDFTLRMNEVDCLRHGVDPYDVWKGSVEFPPYVSRKVAQDDLSIPNSRHVYAYVPWEYVALFPLTWLDRMMAWRVYFAVMFLLGLSVYFVVRAEGFSFLESGFSLLIVLYTMLSDLQVGNFGILSLAAAVIMAISLNKKHDVIAGICWTFLMFKPQVGIIFAVPLLWRRRFLTCAVAACLCVTGTIISSYMCGKSFFELLLAAPLANSEFFLGCGTWPYCFCGLTIQNVEIVVGLAVGLVICLVMTANLRKCSDWHVYLMPAAICACSWSYAHSYCFAMGWFVAFVVVRELLKRPHSRFLWTLAALSAFSLSRWPLAWHGLSEFVGWGFPMSEYAFRCLDSLNSTLSLAIAFALCLWFRRNEQSF